MTTKNRTTDWEKAEEYGIDVTILWNNLQMLPTDRLIAHQKALENAHAVRSAGADYYAKLSKKMKRPKDKEAVVQLRAIKEKAGRKA